MRDALCMGAIPSWAVIAAAESLDFDAQAQLDPPTFGMLDVSFPGQACPLLVQARRKGCR